MAGIPYQREVDGVRALAVVSVILFHLDRRLLPGGFTGVDVFFVLSGYLITSILVAEQSRGTYSTAGFYQRRIARILPLATLVIVAVLCTSRLIYGGQDFASAGAVAAAASLSLANMKLLTQGNYFEAVPDAQPLLHYWSLSVEEQFYLILPFVTIVAFRTRAPIRMLGKWLAIIAVVSLAGCIGLTMIKPSWAFYLLPTRAWELVAGCLIAVTGSRRGTAAAGSVQRSENLLAWLGLAGLAAAFTLVHESESFPGAVAVIPVASTALLVRHARAGTHVARLLAAGPMVAIGKASYSLYLWHWPVFCFIDYGMPLAPEWERITLKVGLTVAVSVASYRWFESPMRRWLGTPERRRSAFVFAVVSIATIVAVGLKVRADNYISATRDSLPSGGISAGKTDGKHLIALLGDSKGAMYGAAMSAAGSELGCRVTVLAVSAANPLPPDPLYADSLRQLDVLDPDAVVFGAAWEGHGGSRDVEAMRRVIDDLRSRAEVLVILGEPPILPVSDYRSWMRSTGSATMKEEEDVRKRRIASNAAIRSLASDDVKYVEVDDLFLNESGEIRLIDDDGTLLFHDKTHLSSRGASMVMSRVQDILARRLEAGRPGKASR